MRRLDRVLRSRKKCVTGNSILDVSDDQELLSLLCNIASEDEMVMKCLEEELSEYYDQYMEEATDVDFEIGHYSAVESDYREPKGYKTKLKRPPE